MDASQIRITDTFQVNYCGICGYEEINQYFGVNDNFIEYCGVFHSFREILNEALDIQIDHDTAKSMEVCLDCKDKVIKFYHFKRKVKQVQQNHKNNRVSISKNNSKISEKRSKVVHNIYQIIENYTEKCSVSTIRVNENSKKLIIESSEASQDETPAENNYDQSENQIFFPSSSSVIELTSQPELFSETGIMIKEEPLELMEVIRSAYTDNNDNSEDMGSENDRMNNLNYFTPSTSYCTPPSDKRPRLDDSYIELGKKMKTIVPIFDELEVRMKKYFDYKIGTVLDKLSDSCDLDFQKIKSREELIEFEEKLSSDEGFRRKMVNILKTVSPTNKYHNKQHSLVGSYLVYLFDKNFITCVRWSERSGVLPPVARSYLSHYPAIITIIRQALGFIAPDGTVTLPPIESVRGSIQNYFKHHK